MISSSPTSARANGGTAPIRYSADLRATLQQMLSVLEQERLALSGLDIDAIMGCAVNKQMLCEQLDGTEATAVDEECQGLLDAARRLNETNRRVRNLIAANVSARLDALTGAPAIYRARAGQARAARAVRMGR